MIINGVEILGAGEPIPGMEVTWQSIFKRFKNVFKSRTIGLRKGANFIAPAALASVVGGASVLGVATFMASQDDAHVAGKEDEVAARFEAQIKALGLTPEEEEKVKTELDKSLPKEDELEKTPDEPTACPVIVEWYKHPAVWIVSIVSTAIIGGIIYYMVKRRKH